MRSTLYIFAAALCLAACKERRAPASQPPVAVEKHSSGGEIPPPTVHVSPSHLSSGRADRQFVLTLHFAKRFDDADLRQFLEGVELFNEGKPVAVRVLEEWEPYEEVRYIAVPGGFTSNRGIDERDVKLTVREAVPATGDLELRIPKQRTVDRSFAVNGQSQVALQTSRTLTGLRSVVACPPDSRRAEWKVLLETTQPQTAAAFQNLRLTVSLGGLACTATTTPGSDFVGVVCPQGAPATDLSVAWVDATGTSRTRRYQETPGSVDYCVHEYVGTL